jgi:hypothetical protein
MGISSFIGFLILLPDLIAKISKQVKRIPRVTNKGRIMRVDNKFEFSKDERIIDMTKGDIKNDEKREKKQNYIKLDKMIKNDPPKIRQM